MSRPEEIAAGLNATQIAILERAKKALAPFDRIWSAIESVQEMDRDATLTRWLHINGPAACGGSFLEEAEVLEGYRTYKRLRYILQATKG